MNLWPWGWLAIGGPVVGVLGGFYGAYRSVHHAQSGAERRFHISCVCGISAYVALELAVLAVVPQAWRQWVMLPYVFGLVYIIRWMNDRQQRIRQQQPVNKI